ncbi:transcriptional regulator, XRE family with cupin sensor [Paenibacillus algorifonticola]|uniref:Transcriptional regulator, XRE family with cupin sensor n=1 Tax=Paenibacillus algorifonticola TaxID=684063 RepID=A0A1I2J2A9_9BACL|nr:cupin domain-containing protein [Paenibacillus algorifonticola]SFF48013.1 transcriptional regulator, XRE family with cupin sensor [Paenibacillus algorifonticola]
MDIGNTIRSIRKKKQLSIQQVAELTGLSQGFLSQVENNKTSPSISTLDHIAGALNVPLAFLLLKKDERMQILRKDERRHTLYGGGKMKVEQLSERGCVKMMLVELEPGASTAEAHAHAGEEIHFLLSGTIYVEQGDESATIYAGDSFSWKACMPHYAKNIGEDTAIVLISINNDTQLV